LACQETEKDNQIKEKFSFIQFCGQKPLEQLSDLHETQKPAASKCKKSFRVKF
jgi:hypothetical protein